MIELSEHLLDLIFRQKSAVVPDIGTFKFEFRSARLDYGQSLLIPPSQVLTFNESTNDEGTLSFRDFLIREKGFDPYEAGIRVKAFSHQIKNTIKQLGYCYLPGMGTLHLEGETHLHFVPGDRIKAIKPTMGLPEIHAVAIDRDFVKTPELNEVKTETFVDTRSERVSSERNKWVLPSVLTFVAVGLGLIGYYIYNEHYAVKEPNTADSLLTKPIVNEDSILLSQHGFVDSSQVYQPDDDSFAGNYVADDVPSDQLPADETPGTETVKPKEVETPQTKTATPITAEQVKKTDLPVQETPAKDPAKAVTTGEGCAIIIGAMGNKDNAVKLAKRVEKAGYTPFSFFSKGLTKVGAACGCDETSINSTLAAMQKLNADAWVYKGK